MYTVCVKQAFVSNHFLVGGDWGAESQLHSHNYEVAVQLEGTALDRHGYLIDITEIKSSLESLLCHFGNQTLNELAEFEGLNPSLENFARIFCDALSRRIDASGLKSLTVQMWEDENSWASYRQEAG